MQRQAPDTTLRTAQDRLPFLRAQIANTQGALEDTYTAMGAPPQGDELLDTPIRSVLGDGPELISNTPDYHFGRTYALDHDRARAGGPVGGNVGTFARLGPRWDRVREMGGRVAEFPFARDYGARRPYEEAPDAATTGLGYTPELFDDPGLRRFSERWNGDQHKGRPDIVPQIQATTDRAEQLRLGKRIGGRDSKAALAHTAMEGGVAHFHLDDMGTDEQLRGLLAKPRKADIPDAGARETARADWLAANPHGDAVTSKELRFVRRHWGEGGRDLHPDPGDGAAAPVAGPAGAGAHALGAATRFGPHNVRFYRGGNEIAPEDRGGLGF